MIGWRFSWRAIGAWLVASVIAALAFSLTLALCNAWADVTGREAGAFFGIVATIGGLVAVGFTLVGGILLLLISCIPKAPRPLTEAMVLAIAYALATTVGGVTFDLNTPEGSLGPSEHPAAFIVAYIAPAAAGVLMALLYRRLAGARAAQPAAT
jgi:hypothetical protein